MTGLATSIEDRELFRGHRRRMQEANDVLWHKLKPQGRSEGIETEDMQIFVEVGQPRR